MRRVALIAIVGLGTGLLLAQSPPPNAGAGGAAGAPAPRAEPAADPSVMPRTKVFNCTTSGCHAAQSEFPFVHGPTAVGACDACHEYSDPERHLFKRKREGRQLCDFCHIDKTGGEGKVVHEPFAKGDCTGCHNPHGSATRKMLKSETPSGLCVSCHKETMKGAHAHKPAAENCASCHAPHTSTHKKLLSMEPRELCLSCHKEVGASLATLAHPHEPARGDCLQCHTPHASENIRVLKKSPRELCLSCHEKMTGVIASATHPHGAVSDERSCLNCHSAHASAHAKQLVKDEIGACLKCHDAPIVVSKDRTIPAAKEVAVAQFHKHGPIEKGDCAACHDVHGGAHETLLAAPYEKGFYKKYSEGAYPLCFKCHDRALVTSVGAEAKTNFRDGDRNLHAVHVNGTEQGRSCRACHTVHASRHEAMIADSVSFGEWKLPINYAKTATGGSCAPGCHKAQTYERVVK